MKIIVAILLVFIILPASAEDIVLQLSLGKNRYGGIPPVDDCNKGLKGKYINDKGEEVEEVCWQFKHWEIYDAKVKKVISGKLNSKQLKIAFIQHMSFNSNFKKNIYVHLQPLDAERSKFLGVKYYAVSYSAPKSVVCFDSKLPDIAPKAYFGMVDEEECYNTDNL